MILAEQVNQHVSFWQDYLSVQFDPAHLMAELGFSLVFELLQVLALIVIWGKLLKPRLKREVHKELDAEHGVEAHD